jgi:hypothetical protein
VAAHPWTGALLTCTPTRSMETSVTLRRRSTVMLALLCTAIWPHATEAQRLSYTGLFTPHIGVTTGEDAENSSFTFGASVAVVEAQGWGVEFDIAHAVSVGDDRFDDSGLTSAMLSVLYKWPHPRIQPFGLAGAGVLRLSGLLTAEGTTDSRTDFGLMFGGGAHVPLTEVIGVLGDLRYLRFVESHLDVPAEGAFGTWRISAGVTINWPMAP